MILVTGAAGFIGFNLSKALLAQGHTIIGIDNMNNYYDPSLKEARLQELNKLPGFSFRKIDLCDFDQLQALYESHTPEYVCHLAAQAGVRYSITNPFAYQKSNNEGFLNILELSKRTGVKNFVYASSSSVYGNNTKLPFSETDPVEHPISLYAATKRGNELTAYCYSHLYAMPCSGLRFFTVYGPWGRPDMALFLFTRSILENKPIEVFNEGRMMRNFTFIDDIVDGIIRVMNTPKPYELYNIGNSRAENLMDFIHEIERVLDKKAQIIYKPMQPGDVPATMADIEKIKALGFEPRTNIDLGIRRFVDWFRSYYNL